jgi:hypothetical protein
VPVDSQSLVIYFLKYGSENLGVLLASRTRWMGIRTKKTAAKRTQLMKKTEFGNNAL